MLVIFIYPVKLIKSFNFLKKKMYNYFVMERVHELGPFRSRMPCRRRCSPTTSTSARSDGSTRSTSSYGKLNLQKSFLNPLFKLLFKSHLNKNYSRTFLTSNNFFYIFGTHSRELIPPLSLSSEKSKIKNDNKKSCQRISFYENLL